MIDGESIERDLGQLAPGVPQSVGTHMVRMDCDNGSFGMTLANCGKRDDGVVVLHVDPDGAAFKSGVMVGDVLLAIGSERNLDLSMATRFLRNPRYETVFEFAGASRSRMLVVPNPFTAGHNGVIIVADCACGIGVFVKFVESWTGPQRKGVSRLAVGDVILAVNGRVAESAAEVHRFMQKGPNELLFVVAGRVLTAAEESAAAANKSARLVGPTPAAAAGPLHHSALKQPNAALQSRKSGKERISTADISAVDLAMARRSRYSTASASASAEARASVPGGTSSGPSVASGGAIAPAANGTVRRYSEASPALLRVSRASSGSVARQY